MQNVKNRLVLSFSLAVTAYLVTWLFGFLGSALIGAGHGSGVLGYLFFSPVVKMAGHYVYLGLLFWPLIGFMIPWSRNIFISAAIIIVSGICYCGIVRDISADMISAGTTSYFFKVYKDLPDLVALIILAFFVMQASIWISLFLNRFSRANHCTLGAKEK